MLWDTQFNLVLSMYNSENRFGTVEPEKEVRQGPLSTYRKGGSPEKEVRSKKTTFFEQYFGHKRVPEGSHSDVIPITGSLSTRAIRWCV